MNTNSVPTNSRQKMFRIILALCVIAFILLIAFVVGQPMVRFMSEPEEFRKWLDGKGIWGVLAFMGLNILQVLLAVIPGGPFEIGAGYAFGVLQGSIICDIAMTIGATITFLLVRRFGYRFVELFISREKLESFQFLKTSRKSTLILFLIFLVPGSPKDIIAYVMGLTNLPLATWIIINLIGRFPAILLSASSGNALNGQDYEIALLLVIAVVLLYFLGAFFYKRKIAVNKNNDPDIPSQS